MIETIQTTNYIVSVLGIGLFLFASVLIVDLYTKRTLAPLVERFGLILAFLTTLGGTLMALLYSEVFGLIPCGLCWLQRIFLFPQAFINGTALYYRELTAARYGIVLSAAGLVVALYHHYIQMGGSEFVKCPASGGDCAKRYLFEFGFVTFPLLSAIIFIFLIALYVYILKVRKAG